MRLHYAGAFGVCGAELPAKSEAICERMTKTVRCLSHDVSIAKPGVGDAVEVAVVEAPEPVVAEPLDSGTAGASARREFEWRKAKRSERIRSKHPRLGGLILAVSEDPIGACVLVGGVTLMSSEDADVVGARRGLRSASPAQRIHPERLEKSSGRTVGHRHTWTPVDVHGPVWTVQRRRRPPVVK
jgi:hypothetical protein